MGWTSDLLNGLAQLLEDNGVGDWKPGGAYTSSDTGIYIGASPPGPARAIVLAQYGVDEHVSLPHVVAGVQVRTRAGPDPTAVQDLDDAVFDVLHGLTDVTFGEAHVKQMYRRSNTSLGQARDSVDRWERSSNYYADCTHTTQHRPI